MAEISLYECERRNIDYSITYGPWTDATKIGHAVASGDITAGYFYVKTNESDASAILSLSTASAAQMAWVSGRLRVKFGVNTAGLAGINKVFGIWLKLADGTYVPVEQGTFQIKNSIVDNP